MTFEEKLYAHVWRLERPNGDVRSSHVTFRTDGSIGGYSHPNEVRWEITSDERLVLRAADGRVTSASATLTRAEETNWAISLLHAGDPHSVAHRLLEAGPASADQAGQSAIVWENADEFAFTITPAVRALFSDNRFFCSGSGAPRWKLGDIVKAPRGYKLQKYVGVYAGSCIPAIGAFSYTYSPGESFACIGRYCSISWNVRSIGTSHPYRFVTSSELTYQRLSRLAVCMEDFGTDAPAFLENPQRGLPRVGNDVWIGQDVLLARGIELGDGCVVAAGSVVTKDVAAFSIVGGAPARLIKYRFSEGLRSALAELQWWRFAFPDLNSLHIDYPQSFIDELKWKLNCRSIKPWDGGDEKLYDLVAAQATV